MMEYTLEIEQFKQSYLLPIAKDVDEMRNTVASFLELIKALTNKIELQDAYIKELQDKLANVPSVDYDKLRLTRFQESSKRNRNIDAPPEVVAFCLYLLTAKQIPAARLANSGLLTNSRANGLAQWEAQHAADYVAINNVEDIYTHGLTPAQARTITPNYDVIKPFLEPDSVVTTDGGIAL